jgi:hypothetical protein
MYMRDLACCAGMMASYSTASDLVRVGLANGGSINGELAGGAGHGRLHVGFEHQAHRRAPTGHCSIGVNARAPTGDPVIAFSRSPTLRLPSSRIRS